MMATSKIPTLRMTRIPRHRERGVTIVLVAAAMVAIIGMATLSIDVITLYLAKEEAQRSADESAVAAARIISMSGITGDPGNISSNWGNICGPDSAATRTARAVAAQNAISGISPSTVTVMYSGGSGGSISAPSTDCQTLSSTAFGVNPMVTVQVTRSNLPTFFSRLWGNRGNTISATATAEAFNPSNSGNVRNQGAGGGPPTPVQPRCAKPWVVPNLDPRHPDGCKNASDCAPFVNVSTGAIQRPGISLDGTGSGVIGERFWLVADCKNDPNTCNLRRSVDYLTGPEAQPQANFGNNSGNIQGPPNLLYIPNQVGTPVVALPSCTTGDPYNEAVAGCDQGTNYSCGVANAGTVDLSINPDRPTSDGVQCLIHQEDVNDSTEPTGQDYLTPFGAPNAYPFQILAGADNPVVGAGLIAGTPISVSASIVTLPIYDQTLTLVSNGNATPVTFVGFLQVFINAVDNKGNMDVTVLNVSGCGNGSLGTSTPVIGTSPVPVRLITPP